MESAAKLELPGINRFVPVLATVSSVSTLLGLLGSVLGMMTEIAQSPSRLVAGLARALITTAFGLGVAIPAVAGYNYITARIDAVLSEIESWIIDFIKIAVKRPDRSKW
jgi:biopolymer transport protein ExbB/TolQ